MNTIDEWLTTATVHNPERAAMWQEVFGGNVVPVTCFIPFRGDFPGIGEALYYPLDLKAITPEQRERLIASIARRFNQPIEFIRENLDRVGCPILADDVSVSSRDSGLLYSVVGDDDGLSVLEDWDEEEDWYDDDEEDY